jgi:hypothetical protein
MRRLGAAERATTRWRYGALMQGRLDGCRTSGTGTGLFGSLGGAYLLGLMSDENLISADEEALAQSVLKKYPYQS